MPKYYFHVAFKGEHPDTIGTDLPDRDAVRSEATRAAGEALKDIDGPLVGSEWRMTVVDEAGQVVLRISFMATEEHPHEP